MTNYEFEIWSSDSTSTSSTRPTYNCTINPIWITEEGYKDLDKWKWKKIYIGEWKEKYKDKFGEPGFVSFSKNADISYITPDELNHVYRNLANVFHNEQIIIYMGEVYVGEIENKYANPRVIYFIKGYSGMLLSSSFLVSSDKGMTISSHLGNIYNLYDLYHYDQDMFIQVILETCNIKLIYDG